MRAYLRAILVAGTALGVAGAAGLAAYRMGASYEDWWITATGLAPVPDAG